MIFIGVLRGLLDYNPTTDTFTWKTNKHSAKAGSKAGCVRKNGYKIISINGKNYPHKKIAKYYQTGIWEEKNSRNTSGYAGISKFRNKWRVRYNKKCLGIFETIEEAVKVLENAKLA